MTSVIAIIYCYIVDLDATDFFGFNCSVEKTRCVLQPQREVRYFFNLQMLLFVDPLHLIFIKKKNNLENARNVRQLYHQSWCTKEIVFLNKEKSRYC